MRQRTFRRSGVRVESSATPQVGPSTDREENPASVSDFATYRCVYLNRSQDSKDLGDDAFAGPASFRVMRLLDRQLENTLTIECGGGRSKHADSMDLPIERIRLKF